MLSDKLVWTLSHKISLLYVPLPSRINDIVLVLDKQHAMMYKVF